MEKIRWTCPECGKKVSVSEDKAGKRGRCPGCGAGGSAEAGDRAVGKAIGAPRGRAGVPGCAVERILSLHDACRQVGHDSGLFVERRRGMTTKTKSRLWPILLLALQLSGCMTSSKMNGIMSSWEGHNISDLIASWGPPSQVVEDVGSGRIYCYQYSGHIQTPGTYHSTTTSTELVPLTEAARRMTVPSPQRYQTTGTYTPGVSIPIIRFRMFWVDEKGIIYRWSWRGL